MWCVGLFLQNWFPNRDYDCAYLNALLEDENVKCIISFSITIYRLQILKPINWCDITCDGWPSTTTYIYIYEYLNCLFIISNTLVCKFNIVKFIISIAFLLKDIM